MAGGQARVIFVSNVAAFDPNAAPGIHVGDIIADPSGNGPPPRFVAREAPGGPLVTVNLYGGEAIEQIAGSPAFVDGAGGSGDGVLTLRVLGADGLPTPNAFVDVDLVSSGAVTSLGISGGIGTLCSTLVVGSSARVRAKVANDGRVSLALNGATGTTYQFTLAPVTPSPLASLGGVSPITLVSGTLP